MNEIYSSHCQIPSLPLKICWKRFSNVKYTIIEWINDEYFIFTLFLIKRQADIKKIDDNKIIQTQKIFVVFKTSTTKSIRTQISIKTRFFFILFLLSTYSSIWPLICKMSSHVIAADHRIDKSHTNLQLPEHR